MYKSRLIILLSTVMVLGVWAVSEMRIHAFAAARGGIGPDVIVGDMPNITKWGTSGGLTGFSVGTTSCNIGDEQLTWISTNNQHPVISQNLYRVKDGRIEQLGQSWLKHGFFALSQSLCGTCQGTSGSSLGIGCSDPYSSSLNGSQGPLNGGTGGLGPKSEVNVSNGFFPFPPRRLTNSQRGTLGGRIQVLNTEIDPNLNAGAQYFVASQYVQPEDAQAGNDDNNHSYRRVVNSGSGNNVNISISGSFQTVRMEPVINAWQAVHSDVELFEVDIPGDGRVMVGVRTTSQGNGFHTEIAVENLTSHQSVRSLAVDHCVGAVSAPGFRDVDYHAEPHSGTDWTSGAVESEIEWATETFAQNPEANAIRWGTLYSFWCDSDAEPATLTLGLFRPGAQTEMVIELADPALPGDVNQDGEVNLLDVSPFIGLLNSGDYQKEADVNGDGVVNLLDVQPFIDLLGA